MSGLALVVRWDGHQTDLHDARLLASAAPYRSHAGLRELQAGCASAVYLDGGQEPGTGASSPSTTHDRSVLLVSDARIDNRDEIASALDLAAIAHRRDDAALLLAAYGRWGEAFADRLVGDFAVAIWDEARRRLVLARDAMAMRPLVYSRVHRRVLVASDAAQILAGGGSRHLNDACIIASLAGSSGRPEWTFYQDIHRVPPGATVVLDEPGARVRNGAEPDLEPPAGASRSRDHADELRARLRTSVLARLEIADRPGLLLSGGLDSLAIAATAGSLRLERPDLPPLSTFSFAYDDLSECDERSTSDPLVAHYGLSGIPVPASDAWTLAGHPEHGPGIDAPDRFQSHVLLDRSAGHALAHGISVLMTGQRGDAVCGGDVFDYLGRLRDAGPRALWQDLANHSRRTGSSRAVLFGRHVLTPLAGAAWPRTLAPHMRERARRAVAGHGFPPWLRRDAVRRFDIVDLTGGPSGRCPIRDEARCRRYDRLRSIRDGRAAEALELAFARAGVRHVAPWADTRLAASAVSIPQYVITPAGEPKGLLREAMRGLLPESARLAARKRSPQPLYDRGLRRSGEVVKALIHGSRAAARGWVDEAALRLEYERFLSGRRIHRQRFWRFLDVEDWLRRFHDRQE